MAAVVAIAGLAFFGGPGSGGLVVSVGGPGGTAVNGVRVLVDGEEKCADSTCKIADLEPGSYVVKAVAKGYQEMAGKAYEVKSGEQTPINLELIPDGGGTGLKVTSDASGLILTVDGKKLGPLPQSLSDIKPGQHKIEISGSELIKPFEKTINISAGEMFELKPDLELAMGNLIVKLGANAEGAKVALTVNGSRKSLQAQLKDGETEKIKIPADGKRYTISAVKEGFEDFEQEVTFSVEEPVRTITVSMTEEEGNETRTTTRGPATAPRPTPQPAPQPVAEAPKPAPSGTGKININSIPVSTVILDGRPLGSTPKIGVSVSAGAHTVVFVHPQHGRKVRQVNVSSGGTATAAVRFP